MKIVIPGGTGFLGRLLVKAFLADSEKHELIVLSRSGGDGSLPHPTRLVPWNARTLGEWAKEVDGATAVINMTGKSVKCLYTDKVLKTLKDSRVLSTEVVGKAIQQSKNPPLVWIQMSTSSIYAHSLDTPNDEQTGKIGETADKPRTWKKISELVQDWEKAFNDSKTNKTRKVLARSAVVMGLSQKTAFDVFLKLSRLGLGGAIAGGKQMITWIHEADFVSSIKFLLENKNIAGPVNVCSPHPISQGEFMKILRETVGAKFGLPATKWMVELSSYITQIDSELPLKSRYAVPKVLLDNQFNFQFSQWKEAVEELFLRWKKNNT